MLLPAAPAISATADDLSSKVIQLENRLKDLETEQKRLSWLDISGDFRARLDSLRGETADHYTFQSALPIMLWQAGGMVGAMPAASVTKGENVKNNTLLTNRFGLNINANAAENVTVKSRLLMYKVWGHQTGGPASGNYFADRMGATFDGTSGHTPGDNSLLVDYAYTTISNIAEQPVWFSIGRRPSTTGIPTNLRQNKEKSGTAGVPGHLIDYAFDGLSLGYAPDIAPLPGAYAKFCWGRGYDSGIQSSGSPKDTDFMGLNIVPLSTDNLHVELQWDKAKDIFDTYPDSGVSTNLGDITQYELLVTGKLEDLGPGTLNLFGSVAISKTSPNDNLYKIDSNGDGTADMGVAGLLYDAGDKSSRTGNSYYFGGRYDYARTKTKIGAEYNHGSKNWLTFAPAADDMWTSKLGTRGDVYEIYVIQEVPRMAISKRGSAFVRLGYQSYDFEYTGSNSWIGAPKKISELSSSPANAQMLTPIDTATDVYLALEVTF
jgi:hypothetical protein